MRAALTLSALLFAASALLAAPKPATNTLCPVTGEKVTAKSKKVVVRDQEYFYCCGGCENQLKASPDKYLNKDGFPKNAPVKPKEGHAHSM